jgi:hypothetical protein
MPPRRHQSNNNVNTNSEAENGATTRIESMACRALDGTTGMCYSKNECAELDGRSVGLCDDDAGDDGPVCCIGELLVLFASLCCSYHMHHIASTTCFTILLVPFTLLCYYYNSSDCVASLCS